MLTFTEKTTILKSFLEDVGHSDTDCFKTDILFYFQDFDPLDSKLSFLNDLDFEEEIIDWVNHIISMIVLKQEEEEDIFGEFVDWSHLY